MEHSVREMYFSVQVMPARKNPFYFEKAGDAP